MQVLGKILNKLINSNNKVCFNKITFYISKTSYVSSTESGSNAVNFRVADPDPYFLWKLVPEPHYNEKLDPGPHLKSKSPKALEASKRAVEVRGRSQRRPGGS
jgi:hypothetical protein